MNPVIKVIIPAYNEEGSIAKVVHDVPKIVDEIIPEPLGGAHRAPKETADNIKSAILKYIEMFMRQTKK